MQRRRKALLKAESEAEAAANAAREEAEEGEEGEEQEQESRVFDAVADDGDELALDEVNEVCVCVRVCVYSFGAPVLCVRVCVLLAVVGFLHVAVCHHACPQ